MTRHYFGAGVTSDLTDNDLVILPQLLMLKPKKCFGGMFFFFAGDMR
jgi:hypothetical protein